MEIAGEPSQNQNAVDTAIRLLAHWKHFNRLLEAAKRAQFLIEVLFEKDDRDACNNDSYCLLSDVLAEIEKEAQK
jgi:hypothetical protein